ncbi:hypothetical protein Ahy_B03g066802 [Arachis hypogaea]|uniref:Protein FAR1-RELATED SEQUENCE n=1 Tax=Arachis hypogaea TaxID=3818 RepID=A0A445A575_ARAHY|nr:hypothetical protein Ahy_B03g066802 [Arachis hypogaea]
MTNLNNKTTENLKPLRVHMEHASNNGGRNGSSDGGTREVRLPDLEVNDKMEERVFFDEMIEKSDDTEKFQGMYQDEIEQEAVNSEDLGKQEFQAMFDGNGFSHEITFDFYNHYTKFVGFGARKSKTWKNSKGEYVKQFFVCSREEFRPEKYYNIENRKREPKSETRCGCLARFVVRFVAYTGRWHLALFVELHNHDCLDSMTTSRCEGLHSIIAKYVKSQYNLVDFIKHFKRCLTYLRYKEVEADYVSISGLSVLKTALEPLERMDSFGIPCEHIVCVLVFLNILELPKSLVLKRWSKNAKTSTFDSSGVTWESIILSQYGCLMDWCRQLSYVASRRQEGFNLVRDTVMSLIEDFEIKDEQEKQVGAEANDSDGIFPKNPQNCRSKCHPGEKDIQQTNASCATFCGINRNPFEEGLDADAEMGFWASDIEEDYEDQEFWAGGSDASADMELSEEFSL